MKYDYTSINSVSCDNHKDLMAKLNAAGREGFRVVHSVTFQQVGISRPECYPEVTFYMEREKKDVTFYRDEREKKDS